MNAQKIFDDLKKDFFVAGIPIPYERIETYLHYMDSVSALGRCKKKDDVYIIYLSKHAMEDEEQIRSTLAHELIHTIDGCLNHGRTFRKYGNFVYQKLGIRVEIKASKEEAELSGIMDARIRKARYVIRCQKCGELIYRQKKSNVVLHPERYRCRCGGRLVLER